jgi:quercetin dioxygenase-like cupin family protein
MEQLDAGLKISLKGPEADVALNRFDQILKQWSLVMPPVRPLVLDFGLGQFDQTGLIEYWIANEAEAGYCGKYLFVFDGQSCPVHSHQVKHETFQIVRGQVEMRIEGKPQILSEGDVLPVPPGVKHGFTATGGPSLLLEISTPCEIADNRFENPNIPIGR